MAKSAAQNPLSTESPFDKAFAPVALEIGHFARAWNGLHENLAVIFATLVSTPSNSVVALAVWHSNPNDRAQREMLRAANRAWSRQKQIPKGSCEEIAWILNETDSLANKRNDALHSPIDVIMNRSSFEFSIEPAYFLGNPRAKNLVGKDLLIEFARYRAQTQCLSDHATRMWMYLRSAVDASLPERPVLPTSAASQNPKKQPRPKRKP